MLLIAGFTKDPNFEFLTTLWGAGLPTHGLGGMVMIGFVLTVIQFFLIFQVIEMLWLD
jgi:hypothetical protein